MLLTGVEAHGKSRGGSKKPSRKSKLQLSPWSTVHWELSLHISSPATGWNWVGLAQSARPRVEEGLLCAGWPKRTFPARASDFWTWVNGWLCFLDAALHQDTLSSQSQHWLWNACAPSSKSSGLPESSLSDSETKLFSQAQEPVYWGLNLSLLKNILYLLPFIFGQTQESMCCRKPPTLSYRPWCYVCSCIAIWF